MPLPPLPGLWGLKHAPPRLPHHCTRCGCRGRVGSGPSWQWSLGGPLPAESANSVPAARPHSAFPPAHFPEWLGLPLPIQHKNYPRLFLGCPPRCQGLGSAAGDHGRRRIPSSAQCEKQGRSARVCLTPSQPQKHSDPQWVSWFSSAKQEARHGSHPFSDPQTRCWSCSPTDFSEPGKFSTTRARDTDHSIGAPATDSPV